MMSNSNRGGDPTDKRAKKDSHPRHIEGEAESHENQNTARVTTRPVDRGTTRLTENGIQTVGPNGDWKSGWAGKKCFRRRGKGDMGSVERTVEFP